jgi:hypothetical protein
MSVERICYSVAEAAHATGYSETRIRKSIRERHLKAGRPSGKGDYRTKEPRLDPPYAVR